MLSHTLNSIVPGGSIPQCIAELCKRNANISTNLTRQTKALPYLQSQQKGATAENSIPETTQGRSGTTSEKKSCRGGGTLHTNH